VNIRAVRSADAPAVCGIYNHYVLHTTITFEQEPVTAPDMAARIADVGAAYPWLVAESEGGVIAYAYATRWRSRAAYDRTVESTIYVKSDAQGAGIGYPLYMALLEALRGPTFRRWVASSSCGSTWDSGSCCCECARPQASQRAAPISSARL